MTLHYDNIVDPNIGNKIHINTKNGKTLIKKYSNLLDKESINLEKKNKKQKQKSPQSKSKINKEKNSKKTKEEIKVIDINLENEKKSYNKDNKIIDDLDLLADPLKISKKKNNIDNPKKEINNNADSESYVASVSTVSSIKSNLSDKSINTKTSDKSVNTKTSDKFVNTKISDKSVNTKISDKSINQLLNTKISGGSLLDWNTPIKENKNKNNSIDSLIKTNEIITDNKVNKKLTNIKSTNINITELLERTITLEEEVAKLKYLLKNLANEVTVKL